MQLQLEDLLYQNKAIQSAVELFKGQSKNVSERPLLSQTNASDIAPNLCLLSPEQLHKNKLTILQQDALAENEAALSEEPQICIEMEIGTGKTTSFPRRSVGTIKHPTINTTKNERIHPAKQNAQHPRWPARTLAGKNLTQPIKPPLKITAI
ncbi:hypothetical protein [Methylobacter svalbardensis]|uniref:hypothetical protein n=1 Tax=Methylobacter svalbardensis TaxID=3080016 RepID=UPI0030EC001D